MSITGQSGRGRIILFNDFCGPEFPVTNAVAYATSPTHAYLGDFAIRGSIHDTDSGIATVASKVDGVARLTSSATADGDGIAVGTELCFTPALNGTLVLEARVKQSSGGSQE